MAFATKKMGLRYSDVEPPLHNGLPPRYDPGNDHDLDHASLSLPKYSTRPCEAQRSLSSALRRVLKARREWHMLGTLLAWIGIELFWNGMVVVRSLPSEDEFKVGLIMRYIWAFGWLVCLLMLSSLWHISNIVTLSRLQRTLHSAGNLALGTAFVVGVALSFGPGYIFFGENSCDPNVPKMKDYLSCLQKDGTRMRVIWRVFGGEVVGCLVGALHISLFVSAVLLGKQSQRRMADKYDVELWTEEGEGSFCVASGSSVSYQDTTVGSKTILDHKTGSESLNMATKVAGETSSSKTTFEAQSISVPTEAGAGVLIKHLWRYKIANNVGIVSNDWTEEEKHTLVGSVKTVNMKRDTGKRRLTLTDADYEEVWTRL